MRTYRPSRPARRERGAGWRRGERGAGRRRGERAMKATDVVLGDDHAVFLDALSAVLAQRGFTVTVARTLAETVESVRLHKPDVCLIDRHFADNDGVRQALQAGASGYLHKTRGVSALTGAIERVLRGEVVVNVPKTAAARRSRQTEDVRRLAAYLTGREWQCLGLLVDGMATTAMAAKLGVSSTTVRSHVQALLTKLGVHSRLEAASFAVRYRLLDDAEPAQHAPAL